jgi:hypothetical protein
VCAAVLWCCFYLVYNENTPLSEHIMFTYVRAQVARCLVVRWMILFFPDLRVLFYMREVLDKVRDRVS